MRAERERLPSAGVAVTPLPSYRAARDNRATRGDSDSEAPFSFVARETCLSRSFLFGEREREREGGLSSVRGANFSWQSGRENEREKSGAGGPLRVKDMRRYIFLPVTDFLALRVTELPCGIFKCYSAVYNLRILYTFSSLLPFFFLHFEEES